MKLCALIALVLLTLLPGAAAGQGARVEATPVRAYSAHASDPHRQFDFWIGSWDVNLRMKQKDLSFLDSVAARASIYSILDGKAILELWDSTPIKGYSLRYYDPELEQWVLSLLWPGRNQASKSRLQGEFRHGRGDFHTSFTDPERNEVRGRYSFNDITPFSLRWDDLWSKDGGQSWAKNWRMEWTRRSVDPVWPLDRSNVPTFVDGARCSAEEFRPYERLVGSWSSDQATLEAYRVLDGCAVMAFFDSGPSREFLIFSWIGGASRWEVDVLDQRRDSGLLTYSSEDDWLKMASETGEAISFAFDGDVLTYGRGSREHRMTSKEN